MGDTWTETTIGALIADHGGSIKTGPFGTTLKAAEYSAEGVPLISVGEIGYGRITIHERTPRVSPAVTSRLSVYLLEEADIVFGRKGAVDRSAIVTKEQSGWFLGSDGIRLRLPKDGTVCEPRYIAYCLQNQEHRDWILSHATGTTMPSLNQGVVERIPIPLPPLPEQRAIARVLGGLDDKIELNRRMNRTLEDLARGVFRSWFVDFDPVLRPAPGPPSRPPSPPPVPPARRGGPASPAPRSAPAAPALSHAPWPTRLTDSPLGPIPEGWRVGTVGEEFKLTMGQSPPGSTYNEDGLGVPFYQGRTDFGFRFPTRRVHCTAPTRFAEAGDTLVSVRAPVGDINMADERCAAGRGVAAVRHKSGATSYTSAMMGALREAFDV
ncbi:MAG: restriction endonuclease subunit S, partial [Gemmatimonadaceae bacterium]|nr:restriction endonuclease subunit S [Gemmatimonadaceae bacterium]